MSRLRCPHCATSLPTTKAAGGELWGCAGCGAVFAAPVVLADGRIQQAARRLTAVPARDKLEALYPPDPEDAPDDLTVPGIYYRLGVLLLLVTLCLFFATYLALLIVSGCMIFWPLRWFGLLGLPLTFLATIIFLYLLKGLFKSEEETDSTLVEITEAEQPLLFEFLYRLCDELGAPPPHRVLLTPDVNGSASYEHSFLGMLYPTPKNLTLGLGLINVLTLSEFKAVLAHEFGHFAQSSMKLGTYVYVVNNLLRNLVTGRDWFDMLLLRYRGHESIAGLIATLCWGVVSGLRLAMTGLFYAINFLERSLSREMEFHADLMAVSASGSEGIVRALSRMDFAAESLMAAVDDLRLASDHDYYSRDLFVHHRDAMERLRRERRKPNLGEPPPLPDDPSLAPEVFDPDDGPPTSMWATHPSNYDREQNAKERYVSCVLDDRPAWSLFDNAAEVREQVTWLLYWDGLKVRLDAELEEPRIVQAFLHEERKAVTYDPCYHGMYDQRLIEPGKLEDLIAMYCSNKPKPAAIREQYAALYDSELVRRAASHKKHVEEKQRLLTYRRDREAGKREPLEFRGRRYEPSDLDMLLEFLDEKLQEVRPRLAKEDRAVFVAHFQMSRCLGPETVRSLRHRYQFHLALQGLLAALLFQREELESALEYRAEQPEGGLPPHVFHQLYRVFRNVRDTLHEVLLEADSLVLPPLPNIKAGARLGAFLYDRKLVGRIGQAGKSICLKKVQKLAMQVSEVIERARHMHFKSLGGILTLQKEIAQRFLAQFPEEDVDNDVLTLEERE